MSESVKLWLDDRRTPPEGWLWVKTVEDAKAELLIGSVSDASLDHDLGACEACLRGRTDEQWLLDHDMQSMPHCAHVGTGSDLCVWMAETGHWPATKPVVHSANADGSARMSSLIERYYGVVPA